MIKAVIFDIDNTLYDFSTTTKLGADAFARYCNVHFGMSIDEAERGWKEAYDAVMDRMGMENPAYHNRLVRSQYFLEKRGLPVFPHAMELAMTYWNTLIRNMKVEEGLVELLEALKNKEIKIGIGTNMTAFVQFEKIRALGISQYVDCMVTSEEAAAEKPTKPFFDYALGKLGISCDECVFIGDDAKNDMQGAKGAGMIPVWYTPHAGEADRRLIEELKVTDRIDNYRECILSDGGIRLGSVRI